MKKYTLKMLPALLGIFFLQGCATTDSPESVVSVEKNNTSLNVQASPKKDVNQKLKKCMFEAEQLSELSGGKYSNKKTELYKAIKQAKYYASVAANVSKETAETMTPYYQFKVNDMCNDIAWTMYNELKAGTLVTSDTK